MEGKGRGRGERKVGNGRLRVGEWENSQEVGTEEKVGKEKED